MCWFSSITVAALLLVSTGTVHAQQDEPTLHVSRAAGPITIDGSLDDPGWAGAAKATGFTEHFPHDGAKPPVRSEAWVTYDQDNLYVALLAFDDPSTIRASVTDRDRMWQDDYFGILLDTYGDASWAYYLFANPYGVQGDSRFATASGEDDGFDVVYRSEAQVTDRGYQIEMAIPFRSLRFPDAAEQTWRATFWRTRPRDARATYSWAAIHRDDPCFLCQFGTLTGIRGVESGGALELLPAAVASRSSALSDRDDPRAGLSGGDVHGEASLTARYADPRGITIEGTVNPDFSQVESDAGQIDVNSTFALFYPERRPFFQEGSELFDSYFDVVYTRQINDPTAAAKVVVRNGRTSVAYLGARDATSPILLPFQERSFVSTAGPSVSNIARVRRTYGESSYVGAMLTDRRFEDGGGSGTDFGVDGVHRFLDVYRFEYQALGSRTVEPGSPGPTADLEGATFDGGRHTATFDGETFSGFGSYTSLERDAEHFAFDIDYWTATPTFRADDGFETRNDYRRFIAFAERHWYPTSGPLDEFTADTRFSNTTTWDGVRKDRYVNPTIEFTGAGQTFLELGPTWESERFGGVDFDGMTRWFVYLESNFSERARGGFLVERGDAIARNEDPPRLGKESYFRTWATLKPIDRLTIEPSLEYSALRDPDTGEDFFRGWILRTRTSLNFSRRLFLRLVLQYDDFGRRFDAEPLVTYRVNPFTLFFVGSNQTWNRFDGPMDPGGLVPTSRQYFAKFQYLFRL